MGWDVRFDLDVRERCGRIRLPMRVRDELGVMGCRGVYWSVVYGLELLRDVLRGSKVDRQVLYKARYDVLPRMLECCEDVGGKEVVEVVELLRVALFGGREGELRRREVMYAWVVIKDVCMACKGFVGWV